MPDTSQTHAETTPPVQIDIISDVMCPWCIVGFRQLEQALGAAGIGAHIRWHPFELNPAMPPEGQNLREHIMEKYGSTEEQSAQSRAQFKTLGDELGINFQFTDDSRIVNTFAAHQLLDWALEQGLQHPLKMALFAVHFGDGRDVSDIEVLVDVATGVGLDADGARDVLTNGQYAEQTRTRQRFWTERGISGVPSMVFEGKYLLTGAQGAATYGQMLEKVMAERVDA
ncbi:MAG: DsbA family oxidoreductase [Sulfitobacter sp.]